jgi:hypothetical protein
MVVGMGGVFIGDVAGAVVGVCAVVGAIVTLTEKLLAVLLTTE